VPSWNVIIINFFLVMEMKIDFATTTRVEAHPSHSVPPPCIQMLIDLFFSCAFQSQNFLPEAFVRAFHLIRTREIMYNAQMLQN
jgi:hypothetical protein